MQNSERKPGDDQTACDLLVVSGADERRLHWMNLLGSHGFVVGVACNGSDAMSALSIAPMDAVIIDHATTIHDRQIIIAATHTDGVHHGPPLILLLSSENPDSGPIRHGCRSGRCMTSEDAATPLIQALRSSSPRDAGAAPAVQPAGVEASAARKLHSTSDPPQWAGRGLDTEFQHTVAALRTLIAQPGLGESAPCASDLEALIRSSARLAAICAQLVPSEVPVLAPAGLTEPVPTPPASKDLDHSLQANVVGAMGRPYARPVTNVETHVLLVEDDVANANAWARGLRLAGHRVTVATSGREALVWAASSSFDAIVSDVDLGDGSGLDLLEACRLRDPELPVILMTGGASWQDAARAVRLCATDYLTKPFAVGELSDTLNEAMQRYRANRLRAGLLAARFGGEELVGNIKRTEQRFETTLESLFMAFQPIVSAQSREVFAWEALLRSADRLQLPTLQLLAAAELLGRTDELGRTVRQAVSTAARGRPDRPELLFINIHPSELRTDLLCGPLEPLLQLAPRVVLEVTERAGLNPGRELDRTLACIRQAGYRIAVDDLGEGYSGLSSLVALRPDFAKIDMSLVRGIETSPLKRDIVAGLVEVCHRAGISVVGEGVETNTEATILEELRVDLLQGFHIARPAADFPLPQLNHNDAGRPHASSV